MLTRRFYFTPDCKPETRSRRVVFPKRFSDFIHLFLLYVHIWFVFTNLIGVSILLAWKHCLKFDSFAVTE